MKEITILVIEDNEQYMADAKKYFGAVTQLGAPIKVEFAKNLREALDKLHHTTAVISDVFFPTNLPNDSELREQCYRILADTWPIKKNAKRHADPINEWRTGNILAPMGVIVAETAQVPIVFCTDGFHHENHLEPINSYAQSKHILLAENDDAGLVFKPMNCEGRKKDWADAYECLIQTIYREEYGEISFENLYDVWCSDFRTPTTDQFNEGERYLKLLNEYACVSKFGKKVASNINYWKNHKEEDK